MSCGSAALLADVPAQSFAFFAAHKPLTYAFQLGQNKLPNNTIQPAYCYFTFSTSLALLTLMQIPWQAKERFNSMPLVQNYRAWERVMTQQ